MNRYITLITAIAITATGSLAVAADPACIAECENNCTSLGSPGDIGLCMAACPANCEPLPIPACETEGEINRCTAGSPIVVSADPVGGPQPASGFRISNDGSAGDATAFVQLFCSSTRDVELVYSGPVTVNPGDPSFRIACTPNFPFAFSSHCGRLSSCADN